MRGGVTTGHASQCLDRSAWTTSARAGEMGGDLARPGSRVRRSQSPRAAWTGPSANQTGQLLVGSVELVDEATAVDANMTSIAAPRRAAYTGRGINHVRLPAPER